MHLFSCHNGINSELTLGIITAILLLYSHILSTGAIMHVAYATLLCICYTAHDNVWLHLVVYVYG